MTSTSSLRTRASRILGDQFTIIALLWFVLELTGSGAAVGLVILCFDLPGLVTGAILGRLLDRYQPRLVMGYDNLARAALIAAIPTLYALGYGRTLCRPTGKLIEFRGSKQATHGKELK